MIWTKGGCNGVSGKWTNKEPFDFDAEFKCKRAVRTWQSFCSLSDFGWMFRLALMKEVVQTLLQTRRGEVLGSTQLTSLRRPASDENGPWFIDVTHHRHGGARKRSDILRFSGF